MPTLGFKNSSGIDIGASLVDKSYLLDRYPEFVDQYRFAGLYMWGFYGNGRLGTDDLNDRLSPVQTVAGGTNWKQVALGDSYSVAIKTDGTLWVWGLNANGQLGTSNTTNYSSPVQTFAGGTNWKQVDASYNSHTGAIKVDGTLWLWGNNSFGQLGTSNVTSCSSPIQTVTGGTNWKQVSCGFYHTACIKTDGTLWMWGDNSQGQLGTFDTTRRSSPIQTIAGGTDWKQVSCGNSHTGAIKADGTLWMWGQNFYGEVGVGNTSYYSSPIQTVTGGTNWKQVNCGAIHTGAIKTDGTLWMWGAGFDGRLGTNDRIHRSGPVQTVAGGTNWKQVACGQDQTGCIKTDGTLWVWGVGRLGTGDASSRSSPVQTAAYGTNWKHLDCGGHFGAIRDDSEDLL